MRFLWFCAGADYNILTRCPYSEKVRYASLGGIVLATGMMAAVAGGFAFFTIFKSVTASLIFGFLWGLMIFNLDRYIVSSSGKGDGTDAITWKEFKSALPRLILAALLGLIISKPLELKIFEPEINSKLQEFQLEEANKRKKATELLFNSDIDDSYAKITSLKAEIKDKEAKRDQLSNKLQEELAGRTGSGVAGDGPTARQLRADLKRMEEELSDLKTRNLKLIEEEETVISTKKNERERQLKVNDAAIAGFDGLIIRLEIMHEIAPTISWMITFLFLAIETTPIFFKMMITIGPFDDIKGKREEFAVYKAKQEIDLQEKELQLTNSKIASAQEEIADRIISKWKDMELQKVEADPEAYFETIRKKSKS